MKDTGHHKKRKIVIYLIFIILALFILLLCYFFFYEPVYAGPIKIPEETLVISHRGFGLHAPDNSLAGVKIALSNRLDGVDVDGQLSSDGELIIFHDLSVDRLTDSTGRVNSKTLEELKRLDLGLKYNNSFDGSYVATFEDFLTTINGSAIFMVELKVPGAGKTGIEERAVEIIKKHDAYDWVYLSSFNPIVLYRLEKLDQRINTVFIFMDTNWNKELLSEIIVKEDIVDLPWFLRQEPIRKAIRKIIKPDLLSVNHRVEEKTISILLDKGYPIFLWTPNNESDINYNLGKKPYGVITDEPLLGKELKDKK